MELGREVDARAEVGKLLEIHPEYPIETAIDTIDNYPYKELLFLDRLVELLRKAGLPE